MSFLTTILTYFGLARPEPQRDHRWPAVAAAWLKEHPTCAACGSRKRCQVHHIYPFAWPNGHLTELDPTNLITLCNDEVGNHHLEIGHLGDYKSRNPDVVKDAAALLAKRQNRPYPPDSV